MSDQKKQDKRDGKIGKPDYNPKSGRIPDKDSKVIPAAGPHARPHLTDPEKTPGAGSLPEPGHDDVSPGTS
jgi:hypothetical protein